MSLVGFTMVQCPHCPCLFDLHMLHLCSGLGPAEVDCIYCRKPVSVTRCEWIDMSWKGRLWNFVISLIYVVLVGVVTGNVVHQSIARWNKNPTNIALQTLAFPITAGIAGGLVILLQLFRIWTSRRRSQTGYRLGPADFFFDLQWNLHLKYFFVLVWTWAIAMIKFR